MIFLHASSTRLAGGGLSQNQGKCSLMNAAKAIAQILKIENVEQVFCFPFTPIIEALAEAGIRPIVARQERVAENMADGFSRTTNGERLGVVTVQQSAGAENAFAGIAQARTDSSLRAHAFLSRTSSTSLPA